MEAHMITPVSLRFCESYEILKIKDAIKKIIEDLGGWGKYISPGERVLLKVNLLTKKKPEDATA